MSSPEVEKFEITDQDLADEFNPFRRQFRQTKNKSTYGIWADPDSDDDRPSFGGGGGGRRNTDYAAPMAFISGGVKVGDKVTKESGEDADIPEDSDSDSEFDRMRVSSAMIGGKSKGVRQQRRYGGKKSDRDMGNWEKHTKGIGAKLLEKMGHVSGKGLGKNLQGIQTPVEAYKRRGKAALGFYGSERTDRSLQDYPAKDSDEDEKQEFQEKLQQWKKVPDGQKQKPKYVYKTAEEAIASGGTKRVMKQSELAKVKVIDMTGKEQRVFSSYQAIASKHDKPDLDDEPPFKTAVKEKKAFGMPELIHNLNMLVEMTEEEIIENNRKLQHEKDMVVNLKHEQEKLDAICKQESVQVDRLAAVLNVVEDCETRCKPDCDNPISLTECAEVVQKLQNDFYEEYKMYELSTFAVVLAGPLLKKYLTSWNPLSQPSFATEIMKMWRSVLEEESLQFGSGENNMDPYARLVWDIVMPHIRSAITNKWNPRNCDVVIELLESWLPVLPPWILQNILDQLIMPRLQSEVEKWNPLTDTVPIHAWLHPWLPLMGQKLQPLFGPIRHKMGNALNKWHPSDPSAKLILQPWKPVFLPGHFDAFVVKNIVPKLELCMQEFVINPHQQILDTWNWVMAWSDMMPHATLVALLEKTFFPKWHQVLCTWLGSNPNYDEVTKWYMGWKSMFSEDLLSTPVIKDRFNKALDMMNQAVSGHYQPGARENVAYLTHMERRKEYPTAPVTEKKTYEAFRPVFGTLSNGRLKRITCCSSQYQTRHTKLNKFTSSAVFRFILIEMWSFYMNFYNKLGFLFP